MWWMAMIGVMAACAAGAASGQNADAENAEARAKVEQFMAGPSVFIENAGQWAEADIKFALDSHGANVGLTDRGPRFQLFRKTETDPTDPTDPTDLSDPSGLPEPAREPAAVPSAMHEFGLVFDGAAVVAPVGRGQSDRTFHYLMGDAAQHREGVPSYDAVWYENLYPGVSLELTGRRTGIKYNFHVAPGADPGLIRLRYEGVAGLALAEDGALQIQVKEDWEPLRDGAPYVYQEQGGERRAVAARFVLLDDHAYGFEVTGAYDPALPLVIDPEVEWGTYLGSSQSEQGRGIAVDADGNCYATGGTGSSGWVSGGWGGGGGWDGYVVKLSASGAHLWSTYMGGGASEDGYGIAVDGSGNCYATGWTASSGWVSGGWDTSLGGTRDAYVVKLSVSGGHLWSTYLGGTGDDYGYGIAVDGSGNCYATGPTGSSDWVSGGWQAASGGGYVVKLSTAGTHLWSARVGGAGYGIAVDGSGNCYATGNTGSSGWVSGGWNTMLQGTDGYVVKLSASGGHLWSSYLGGTSSDYGYGITVDGSGNCYATGRTQSLGWVSGGWDTTHNGDDDGYVVKLGAAGAHVWSSYLGGTSTEYGYGIAVDGSGNCYATGYTQSLGWVGGGWDTTHNGGNDGYVVKLSTSGAHLWSTYFGGSGTDHGYGIAVDSTGSNIWVTGWTASSGWFSGGWDTSFGGMWDGFALKISDAPSQTGSLQVTLTPPEAVGAGARWRRVTTTTWFNSDDTEADITAGEWAIEFKNMYGWVPPDTRGVIIAADDTVTETAAYTATSVDVTWSTYLGGTGFDQGYGIAVDGSGNCYATGQTASSGWVSGGWDTSYGGSYDGYVVKLSTTGGHLWSTYLGGTSGDEGYGIAVDGSGNCYATGQTASSGWVSGGWNTTYNGGSGTTTDGYVVKLSASGGHLWSSYLGGTSSDYGYGIAVDGSGNCYATGQTASSGWVSGGWNTTLQGTDGYVVKLSASGAHLWSTYLGGTGSDSGRGIAVDGSGNCYATGATGSPGWVSGGWDTILGGTGDAYVVKLSATGGHLWSTYLGGTSGDGGSGIAVDGSGNCYATGSTESSGWVSGGCDTTHGGADDAYVVKLSASGGHLWSTYLGGTGTDYGRGIAVDGSGNCYATGSTESSGWVSGGWDTSLGGTRDAYVVKLNAAGAHLWSSYLGGANDDRGYGIAVDATGINTWVTGSTTSAGWVHDGWQTTHGGGTDPYVAKIMDARLTGSLQVTLLPAEAVAAGAQWRRMYTSAWRDSGETETGAPVGYCKIEFKDVFGWVPPTPQTVAIPLTGTAQETATYTAVDVDMNWSTYLGGSGTGYGIAVDASRNCYATGSTASSGWVSGGWDTTHNGGADGYVVKLSTAGAHLWSTYLGGTDHDYGLGIAVDADGNCYSTGYTQSSGWVSGGWNTTHNGGRDGYVVKLSTAGAHLWSTYLGGTSDDYGQGIAVDGSGNCYATGYTYSTGWVSGGWNTTYNGGSGTATDGYVVKLSASGGHLWSTYLGRTNNDYGYGIAVDTIGNCYATGYTTSSGWVSGGWDTTYNVIDGYVVKLDASGGHLWSTYLGGTSSDYGRGVAVDASGNCYATGQTGSPGWVSGGWDTSHNGGWDGYVVKLSTSGGHLWSTYLGGAEPDQSYGIVVDGSGDCYATGWTQSSGWVSGGWDSTLDGTYDAYVVKLSSAGAHAWSSYLGGANDDRGYGIAVDATGTNTWVTGSTTSAGWVHDGWLTTHGGGTDAFVAKISEITAPAPPSDPGATAIGLDTITWTWQDNSSDEDGFKVYDDPGAAEPVTLRTTTAADVEAWQHNGLPANTQHAFQVAATNAQGDSDKTPNFTAWTLIEAVSGLAFSGVDVDMIGVASVNTPSNLAAGLSGLQFGNTTAGQLSPWRQDNTPWVSTGLTPNTQYAFTGQSRNGDAVTTTTATGSRYTLIEAVSGLAFSGVGLGSISVASANTPSNLSSGASGLRFANTTAGTASGWRQNNTPWVSTGLTPNTQYAFTGQSRNGDAVTTPGASGSRYTLIEAVSGLAFSGVTPTSIGVASVNTPSNLASGASGLRFANTTAGTTSAWRQHNTPWASTGLTPNTQYAFAGQSRNGDTIETAPASGSKWTLAAQPLAPSVTNATQHTLDVALTAGDGNPAGTEYAIRVDSGMGGNVWVQPDGTLGAAPVYRTIPAWGTVTVTGLTGGVFYGVFGVARNGEGVDSAIGLAGYGQTLEDVPPTGTVLINGGAAYTNTTAVTLTLSATDNASGVAQMRFSNDNVSWSGWEAYAVGKAWAVESGEGVKTVYAQFRDGVGNVSVGPISDSITLDTIAPTVALSCAAPEPTNTPIAVSVLLSEPSTDFAQPDIARTNATITGFTGGGASYSFTLVPSAQGVFSCSVPDLRFRDTAGNWNAIASNTIARTYDNVPPVGSVVINGGATHTTKTAVTLALSATDSGVGVAHMRFRNAGAVWSGWEAYGPAKAWTLDPGDGLKTVIAQYRDGAGNVSTGTTSDTIALDTAAPTFTGLVAAPAEASEGDTVTITFASSEALDAAPEVTVNSHAATRDTTKADYVYLYEVLGVADDPLGPAYIEISGADLAGNLGTLSDLSALEIVDTATVPAASAALLALLASVTALAGAAALRRRT